MSKKSNEILNDALKYVWHQYTNTKQYAGRGPRMIVEGEGCLIKDAEGREILDAEAGMYTTFIGHGREEIAKAVSAQIKKLEFHSLFEYSQIPATLLAKKIAQLTPGDLTFSCFACTGSEAVEVAIKISRLYQLAKGLKSKYKIISRRRSYHGVTLGALSANGISKFRKDFEPLMPGFIHIPQPDCYHCDLNKTYPSCDIDCAYSLEKQILFEGPETVAAFIGEPVSVADGCIIPKKEYWTIINKICKKYEVLLISDEVLVGFGRTGKWFAVEHWDLEPDILTLAKAITSGYIPLSVSVVNKRIADVFKESDKYVFQHGGTYSGHPTCCAAALENIKIIEQEKLVDRAMELGIHLGKGLMELEEYPFVGLISGIGLIYGIELVENKKTRKSLDKKIVDFIREEAYTKGLTYRYRVNGINVAPPATITYGQIDKIIEILKNCFDKAVKKFC